MVGWLAPLFHISVILGFKFLFGVFVGLLSPSKNANCHCTPVWPNCTVPAFSPVQGSPCGCFTARARTHVGFYCHRTTTKIGGARRDSRGSYNATSSLVIVSLLLILNASREILSTVTKDLATYESPSLNIKLF